MRAASLLLLALLPRLLACAHRRTSDRVHTVFEQLVLHSVGTEHQVEGDPTEESGGRRQTQRVRATVQEACPKCKHPELQYYTMQLRSADEGQTVFYECARCGHTFSTNT